LIYLLPASSKQLFIENDIIRISNPYILIQTNHYSITLVIILIFQKLLSKMGRTMIDEVINSQKYKEKYEILEKVQIICQKL
jgi:hypothetical protein